MFKRMFGKSEMKGGEKMKIRLISAVLVATALFAMFASPIAAATTAPVTITAVPAYIALTVSPDGWTLNDLVGDGVSPKGTVAVNTIYYSNPLGDATAPSDPVVDGECNFTATNTSSITTDLFISCGDFTGGSAAMTNSDTGANGAATFGSYSYCTGMTYSTGKVVCKVASDTATKESLAPSTNIKFGLYIETRENVWAGGTASTAIMVASLAAA